jgi:hypothetical protein
VDVGWGVGHERVHFDLRQDGAKIRKSGEGRQQSYMTPPARILSRTVNSCCGKHGQVGAMPLGEQSRADG